MLIVIVDDPTGYGAQFSVLPLVLRRGLDGDPRPYSVRNDSGCEVGVHFDTPEITPSHFSLLAGASQVINVDAKKPDPIGKTTVAWTLTKTCPAGGRVTTSWSPGVTPIMGRPDVEIDDP
jgi:hypothetical protein